MKERPEHLENVQSGEAVLDPQEQLMHRFIPFILWLAFGFSVLFAGYLHIFLGIGILNLPVALWITLIGFGSLLIVRTFFHNHRLIANLLLMVAIVGVLHNVLLGTTTGLKGVYFVNVIPFIILALKQKRSQALFWLGGYGLVLLAIVGGVLFGALPSAHTPNEIFQSFLASVFTAGIMLFTLSVFLRYQRLLQKITGDQEKTIYKLNRQIAESDAITESLGQALIVSDAGGDIMYVNKAFEELMGWSMDEVVGQSVIDLIPREDEERNRVVYEERILTKVLKGQSVEMDVITSFYYIAKDGSRFPVSSTISPITLDNEIIGAVEVFRDISKEKEIDTQKTEFVSLASHQLRTPLSTINWYTEMLIDGDAGDLNEKQKKYTREVYNGSRRMVGLVDALLDVSRLELGTFMIQPQPTDVVKLLRSVLDEVKPVSDDRKLKVTEEHDDLPKISLDPKLMRMIMQNLITNAVKYTPEGGSIHVVVRKNNNNLQFSVSDTGMGIPAAQEDKIFTKLFRADNVKETDTEGTGLGLYIVKQILDHSDGDIWFESEEGKGTTFYVRIPLSGMKQKEGEKKLGS